MRSAQVNGKITKFNGSVNFLFVSLDRFTERGDKLNSFHNRDFLKFL